MRQTVAQLSNGTQANQHPTWRQGMQGSAATEERQFGVSAGSATLFTSVPLRSGSGGSNLRVGTSFCVHALKCVCVHMCVHVCICMYAHRAVLARVPTAY